MFNIRNISSPEGFNYNFDKDDAVKKYCAKKDKATRITARRKENQDSDVICLEQFSKTSRKGGQQSMDDFLVNGKKKRESPKKIPATDGFVMASGATEIVREVKRVVSTETAVIKPIRRDQEINCYANKYKALINNKAPEKRQIIGDDDQDSQSELRESILNTIVDTTGVTLSDIVGNHDAKRALEESVILPTLNPLLFTGLREPCKGILLFGPPGNGKTMLAKAVAAESKCTFFNISAATIMSKWVGEGERLMQTLFNVARANQPSIIFIDEVDSLLCQRTEKEDGVTRRVKTEFLLQFDGCNSCSGERILVLGATNRPQELDDGVLRRFPRRIYIDLPGKEARANLIIEIFTKTKTPFVLDENAAKEISDLCEGYSFSDLTALCKEAAMAPLRALTREQLQNYTGSQLPPVSFDDLKAAMSVIKASANPENTLKMKQFASKFGQT